jgi:hypothetical protein
MHGMKISADKRRRGKKLGVKGEGTKLNKQLLWV